MGTSVGVGAGVSVGRGVGVRVGSGVGVSVAVAVNVGLAVKVLVTVKVGVCFGTRASTSAAAVGVGCSPSSVVSEGSGSEVQAATAAKMPLKTTARIKIAARRYRGMSFENTIIFQG